MKYSMEEINFYKLQGYIIYKINDRRVPLPLTVYTDDFGLNTIKKEPLIDYLGLSKVIYVDVIGVLFFIFKYGTYKKVDGTIYKTTNEFVESISAGDVKLSDEEYKLITNAILQDKDKKVKYPEYIKLYIPLF
jgi:hypothetical protein